MLDPEFEPGSVHTAVLTVTNTTKWYWEYEVELFLAGTSLGSQDIALNGYDNGSLNWNITMPGAGTYTVYAMVTCTTTGQSLGKFPLGSVTIISPSECTPGERECRGYDLWHCTSDGKWHLEQANSPTCGYVPTPTTKCVGYDLYELDSAGNWVLVEPWSPQCGCIPGGECIAGTFKCVGKDLYGCYGHCGYEHWALHKANAKECGGTQ